MGKWSQKTQIRLIFQQQSWVWICSASWLWVYAPGSCQEESWEGQAFVTVAVWGWRGMSSPVTHQEQAPPCPARPSPAQPSWTTPHHSDLLSPWPSLLQARQLWPCDHKLCFFVENRPQKASCWHWRKKMMSSGQKNAIFGRDNTRIDEALLCGLRSTDLAQMLNRW